MEAEMGRNLVGASVLTLIAASAMLAAGYADDQFSDWEPAVNLGSTVNTESAEICPSISRDGLSLYFFSDRPGGFGGNDLYVSQRASVEDPWGQPHNLGPAVNTAHDDSAVMVSLDGHRLYLTSDRPGGFGGLDLYVSRRQNKRDDFAWRPPTNLGDVVNTPANELSPFYSHEEESRTATLYFASNRPGGLGADDIYASALETDGTFGPPALVYELSSAFLDRLPAVRRDGLEMFITSNRPGTLGLLDLWVATRSNTRDPWSLPVNLGSVLNTPEVDGCGRLSFDAKGLYFHSTRARGFPDFDIYFSVRSKLRIPE